ncbi:MAG: hypothetical protein JWN88_896 [Frankiales bacterium]|nr:hypothetical protein [Frankiales bacterium]
MISRGFVNRVRAQAAYCRRAGSPLTAAILDGAAEDLEQGGPTAALLGPLVDDPAGSLPPLRFTAALHRIVLERRAPALALHYPSVGGTPGDVWPAAREVVAEHLDLLAELVRNPVQTNEVGRSTALLGGLLSVVRQTGLPVRLLEVGASAGLNLLFDRYAHAVADDAVLGDPASPVRLLAPWTGQLPAYDVPLEVVERLGCDPAPLDPTSAADRLTLTSCVWADQVVRFERLRGALQIAAAAPPRVERSSGSAFLERELAAPREGVVTVVWHSVVRQYLGRVERERVSRVLDAAGARAGARTPLVHLTLEPEHLEDSSTPFQVRSTLWPGGQLRVLADCEAHGPPVRWR